ncbi:MAG: hypothetical protein SFX73_27995 [Kofleriaceae bacterium]|nr:hypothetical protein [Kofleriaceae bacterium]
MRLVAPLLALVAVTGCGKATCEKYADMEWQCGNYPADEKNITRVLSQGACEAGTSSPNREERAVMEIYAREGECAAKHPGDCAAYEACKNALRDATRRAER